jgi:hypothetical protein
MFIADLSDSDATAVARHWNAVRRFLETVEDADLSEFQAAELRGIDPETGRHVVARLETDPDAIELLAQRGEVTFESIYDEVQ